MGNSTAGTALINNYLSVSQRSFQQSAPLLHNRLVVSEDGHSLGDIGEVLPPPLQRTGAVTICTRNEATSGKRNDLTRARASKQRAVSYPLEIIV